jgi:putative ABC transport system permease protein
VRSAPDVGARRQVVTYGCIVWFLAIKTLLADRGKLATALVGVVFSVVLVNLQGGLFLGLMGKASLMVDYGHADIWVGHRGMHNVDFTQDVPVRWGYRIRGIPGVKTAEPYVIGWSSMALPSGSFESVVVVGCEPASLLGNAWNISQGQASSILEPDGIVVDELEAEKLEYPRMREIREINGHRARIVATSRGILGFLVAPYVFTTLDRAASYLEKPLDACSYFLVQLEPGADAHRVCELIHERVPHLDAQPRDEYARMSTEFWMTRTGLGIIFGLATQLGLLVGLVMVAQTLYASVLDRIGEFGTLKAIGAKESQVYRILLAQALMLAALGSIVGLGVVAVVQHYFSSPRTTILIPLSLSLGSCALVLVICLVSSLLPYLRVRKVDPMMVLRS